MDAREVHEVLKPRPVLTPVLEQQIQLGVPAARGGGCCGSCGSCFISGEAITGPVAASRPPRQRRRLAALEAVGDPLELSRDHLERAARPTSFSAPHLLSAAAALVGALK